MNLALNHRGSLTTASTTATPARRSRAADYLADICLIALLASPFMLLEAPAARPDGLVASRAGPAAVSQPAIGRTEQHVAATDRR